MRHPESAHTTSSAPQGSISLIMIFILAIGSLMGLLSTYFIQDMISSTKQLREFYQSYYIAKGGTELGILAVNNYEYGFESEISSDTADILSNNLHHCRDCSLSLSITSRVAKDRTMTFGAIPEPIVGINNSDICTNNTLNRIILSPGASYILPLFADQRKFTSSNGEKINNLLAGDYNLSIISTNMQSHPFGLSVILGDKNMTDPLNGYNAQPVTRQQALTLTGSLGTPNFNINTILNGNNPLVPSSDTTTPIQTIKSKFSSPSPFNPDEDYYNYLAITNSDKSTDIYQAKNFEFCLTAEKNSIGYSIDTSIIKSIGRYNQTSIGLQAIYKKPLLDYIINSSVGNIQ